MNTTPAPAVAIRRIASNSTCTSSPCSAVVGSSSTSTLSGRVHPSKARAIATIARCAGDNVPTGTLTSKSTPNWAISSRACRRSAAPRTGASDHPGARWPNPRFSTVVSKSTSPRS